MVVVLGYSAFDNSLFNFIVTSDQIDSGVGVRAYDCAKSGDKIEI